MQSTILETGDPVVAKTLQQFFNNLATAGILDGFNLSVSAPNTIAISPGSALTSAGVMIIEDETKELTIGTFAQNYTIYYQHQPSNNLGGIAAQLLIQPGFLDPDTFTNGVILAWVQYPGGPLVPATMFISGRRLKLAPPYETVQGEFTSELAPLSSKWVKTTQSGPAASLSEPYDGTYKAILTQLTGPGPANSIVTYLIPFQVSRFGLGQLAIESQVDTGAQIQISVINDQGLEVVPVGGNNFFSAVPMAQKIFTLPISNSFESGKLCYVKLIISLQASRSVRIKRVSVSSYQEPLE